MITLEDGKRYYIVKEIEDSNTIYVYLTDMQDVANFCIRKKDDKKENLIGLKDETEYFKSLELYKTSFLES